MEAMGVSSHWAEHISLHPALFWMGRGMIDDPGTDRSTNICIFSLWILSSSELSDITKSNLSIFQCLPTNQPVTSNTGLVVQLL